MSISSSFRTLLVLCGVVSVANALLVTDGQWGAPPKQLGLPVQQQHGTHPRRYSPYSIHPRQSQWTVGQTVPTSSGPVIGHGASNLTDVSEYLGIPYAEPPVGPLRFQPPVRCAGTSPINASAFSPSCFASLIATTSPNPDDYADMTLTPTAAELLKVMYGATATQSEDCLTLNIWTKPQTGDPQKAVLIWIHGGGYTSGGSAIPWYNGQYLAGKEDVVVVSINYRLSIFGFPGNPTTKANLGLLDQRLAVEWARDNIAAFGGDPDRITLFGQSAGGGSVDHYSYAWTADPIVRGLIPMSGTAAGLGLPTGATANDNWFNTTAGCGCGTASDDPQRVHECMLSRPARDIATNITRILVTDAASGLPFSPTVDEEHVFSDYTARKPMPVPVLIGNTDFETGLFRLLAPTLPDLVWPLINDVAFDCPAALRASQSVRAGNPTWRYRWFGDFANLVLSTVPPSGSWHASELPVLFNTTPTALLPDTPDEEAIGSYMRGAWAAFAKDPVHGLLTYGWPRYSTNGSTLVRLAYDNQTGPNLGIGNMYDAGCGDIPNVESPRGNETTGTGTVAGGDGGTGGTGASAGPVPTGNLNDAVGRRANLAMVVALVAAAVLFCGGA